MSDFSSFFLMTPDDVRRYAVEVLGRFAPDEPTCCTEIGDGNINYVFRIRSEADGRSVVVKQADRLLRSSGRLLDQNRSRIEAAILRLEAELAPEFVPEVYHYDEVMAATAMEDISDYKNLRRELMAGRFYPHLAESISTFLADTLLPTTDLVLDAEEKKRRVQFFTNPELCKITEDLVLTEPYYDYKGRNILTSGTGDFVRETLYSDEALHAEVAALRLGFMNNAQALLHGDLHSGSIFINDHGIKILDPEFAFYGPMGYDIGNVIGNLFFAWANKVFTDTDKALIPELEQCIVDVYDKTAEKLSVRYDELVAFPLYRVPAFQSSWCSGVMADSVGYAGTEIIRRTVGDSKVMEITSVTDLSRRVPMERALIRLGTALIKNRTQLCSGTEITACFRRILADGEEK